MRPIRVLVIDDSALVREVLSQIFHSHPATTVVDTARDALDAVDKIKQYRPDVLTLDLQMPKMNGLDFLEKLMATNPMPVIVISSLTSKGSAETIRALDLGAVDFVTKPKVGISRGLEELAEEIIRKVKNASQVKMDKVRRMIKMNRVTTSNTFKTSSNVKRHRVKPKSTVEMIAIGASTGGTVALRNILYRLPNNLPPIVAVLHMPPNFTRSYAESLNANCSITVQEGKDGEQLQEGHTYIAPGGKHLLVEKGVSGYYLRLNDDPPLNHHRPSVDKTFYTIAKKVAPNCIGVILTGMGDDGANAMKDLHDRGSFTIAQDETTSIVYGMPKQAVELGAIDKILPLEEIAKEIVRGIDS